MSQPQIQVFVVRTSVVPTYGWRMLSRNHRELGRAARLAASPALAREDVLRVRRLAREGRLREVLSSRPTEGGWRWSLVGEEATGAVAVAVSHRAYSRRRECLAPLQQFLELLVEPDDLRFMDLPVAAFRPGRAPLPPRPARAPLLERVVRQQPLPGEDDGSDVGGAPVSARRATDLSLLRARSSGVHVVMASR